MTRTDKDRAFRIQKPPGYFSPQAWHRLRHATPRRNDACIAKACFFAGRLAVDHRDGQSAFSQLQGTADANDAGTDHNHLITVCPSACSHHPCKPVSNGLCSCPLPTTGGPLTCLSWSALSAQARGWTIAFRRYAVIWVTITGAANNAAYSVELKEGATRKIPAIPNRARLGPLIFARK